MLFDVTIDGKQHRLQLERAGNTWDCKLDGREIQADAVLAGDLLSLLIDGVSYEIRRETTATGSYLWVGNTRHSVEVRDPRSFRGRRGAAASDDGPQQLVAPMPGKVVRILVAEQDQVQAGQGVLVVEAMKMQNEIKSPKQGILKKLLTSLDASVNAGEVLAIVE